MSLLLKVEKKKKEMTFLAVFLYHLFSIKPDTHPSPTPPPKTLVGLSRLQVCPEQAPDSSKADHPAPPQKVRMLISKAQMFL